MRSTALPLGLTILFQSCLFQSCIPGFLEKYVDDRPATQQAAAPAFDQIKSEDDAPATSTASPLPAEVDSSGGILATRGNAFIVNSEYGSVWEALLTILIENYHLVIIDEKNGIITTDWDKFYKANLLYRNKLTIRLTKAQSRGTELLIKNSQEALRSDSGNPFQNEWLPFEDDGEELSRVIKNVAIVLNLPPPNFNVARQLATKNGEARF